MEMEEEEEEDEDEKREGWRGRETDREAQVNRAGHDRAGQGQNGSGVEWIGVNWIGWGKERRVELVRVDGCVDILGCVCVKWSAREREREGEVCGVEITGGDVVVNTET